MQKIVPFLWFDEQAEEAANFYTALFKNAQINAIHRFGDEVPGPRGKVMTVSFQLAGLEFTALNGGPEFTFTPAISFFVSCQSAEEVDRLWQGLVDGGEVLMALDRYPFSERYGWLNDRYGVSWQLSLAGTPQKISPCLMFVGAQQGKAEAAIHDYVALFEDSGVEQIERYGPSQDEPEGSVMFSRFTLAGQEFMAMDSAQDHHFTFSVANSFYVNCEDQMEVDYFWEKLSAGGEKGQCGWLTDRYGVSWQVVPTALIEMMNDPDAEKARRVTQAMLKMSKIDLNELERAYVQA